MKKFLPLNEKLKICSSPPKGVSDPTKIFLMVTNIVIENRGSRRGLLQIWGEGDSHNSDQGREGGGHSKSARGVSGAGCGLNDGLA